MDPHFGHFLDSNVPAVLLSLNVQASLISTAHPCSETSSPSLGPSIPDGPDSFDTCRSATPIPRYDPQQPRTSCACTCSLRSFSAFLVFTESRVGAVPARFNRCGNSLRSTSTPLNHRNSFCPWHVRRSMIFGFSIRFE